MLHTGIFQAIGSRRSKAAVTYGVEVRDGRQLQPFTSQ